ncbi:MAG: sigma-70 family RNA polymerase sigma factor [Phycisphaerales bacterium]|nr:MAG: sigma-70 family RNA polymerase sigma factor [Phycisphaerales bacterium]
MPDVTIQQLTAAIASGDTEAFGHFYEMWFDFMYAQARRATQRDETTCLDIVQDAMMRVIRSIRPFEEEARFRRWLTAVVNSCAYDRLRSESRRKAREQVAADRRPDHETVDDLRERLDWLRDELGKLDDFTARLLTMRHRFGWTLKQIGTAVGLSPSAVDGRLSRALGALRRRGARIFQERGEP